MSSANALAKSTDVIKIRKAMTSREIKAAMILRGITVKEIAEQAGVSVSAVTQTITRYPSSRYLGLRIRPYIAKALDCNVEDIWPV